MSRSYTILLATLATLAAPTSAFANCPTSLATAARMNCLNNSLNAAFTRILALEAELEDQAIPHLEDYLSVDASTDSIIFTGANVYVQSGSGATDGAVNGLGNLVIGYNEILPYGGPYDRGGSHNVVVGPYHAYSSYGSLVTGWGNTVSGVGSVALGGDLNEAEGGLSVILGGEDNWAYGSLSSVFGGWSNEATGEFSTASGGQWNVASGYASSASGYYNTADAYWSSVSGGEYNEASGTGSSVSGGEFNFASGDYSSILGGYGVKVGKTDETSP
jgi:hypothetical protein